MTMTTGPGDICGSPPDDCFACRAACGTCPDGKTQWGCCGECYVAYNETGDQQCVGFKPRFCDDEPTINTTDVFSITCATILCNTGSICVEDTGDGSPGCVTIGDECKSCDPIDLVTNECDDGTCRGSCGCVWGYDLYTKEVVCRNNIVLPPECMYYIYLYFSLLVDILTNVFLVGPGDVCGSPPDDCFLCRAACGTCPDGETQWGCCGECYVSYNATGDQQCGPFKPRICDDEPTTTDMETTSTTGIILVIHDRNIYGYPRTQ